ncbi:unnamed protein product [Meloidogyne enterolobii]|uniref:Uncharacterized protein n=3 Tax=Meloidogyne enterolobii TaxID=390850 RepID=A0A6V7X9R8_MELEN|nr:unnamed protein product [Meloidogyne enterolobii]
MDSSNSSGASSSDIFMLSALSVEDFEEAIDEHGQGGNQMIRIELQGVVGRIVVWDQDHSEFISETLMEEFIHNGIIAFNNQRIQENVDIRRPLFYERTVVLYVNVLLPTWVVNDGTNNWIRVEYTYRSDYDIPQY